MMFFLRDGCADSGFLTVPSGSAEGQPSVVLELSSGPWDGLHEISRWRVPVLQNLGPVHKTTSLKFKHTAWWMAQRGNVYAVKFDNPKTHVVERNDCQKLSLGFHTCSVACAYPHTYASIHK